MADLLLASAAIAKATKPKESFGNFHVSMGSTVLSIIIMILSFALSWNCNKGTSQPLKIIYAIIAALFGWMYLVYYVVAHVGLDRFEMEPEFMKCT